MGSRASPEEKARFDAAVLRRENELLRQVLQGLLKGISAFAEVATDTLKKGRSNEPT
jgi:hypothetical protein